jgi:hypothetical protein
MFNGAEKMFVRSLNHIAGLKQFLRKFVRRRCEWSIGIYLGKSHVDLAPPETISNPVLTAKDITDVPADFVADPFMLHENGTWYMFFEVMNARDRKGDIGLATSVDGLKWTYQQIVLSESFHLSYPYVFKKLTPTNYEEKQVKQNPILIASRSGWNKIGMHNIDPHQLGKNKWIACVDGYSIKVVLLGHPFDSDFANWSIGTLFERIEQLSKFMRLNY